MTLPHQTNFNPRSSWEERHYGVSVDYILGIISIHAPRERSDFIFYCFCKDIQRFQSTLLVRGATVNHQPGVSAFLFQSTLLVRGATKLFGGNISVKLNFNPRSSWEERRELSNIFFSAAFISIHAPRERSDDSKTNGKDDKKYFKPRSSWEERRKI